MVSRAIFVLLSALAGMALFLRADAASASYWLYGFGIGAVTGGLIVGGDAIFHSALLSGGLVGWRWGCF